MSTFKYCDNFYPHKSHQWTEGEGKLIDHRYCCGVKTSHELDVLIEERREAKERLRDIEDRMRRAAKAARVTEDEFYGLVDDYKEMEE